MKAAVIIFFQLQRDEPRKDWRTKTCVIEAETAEQCRLIGEQIANLSLDELERRERQEIFVRGCAVNLLEGPDKLVFRSADEVPPDFIKIPAEGGTYPRRG